MAIRYNENIMERKEMKEELKKALEALEIVDTKLFESDECPDWLYNEVSDYIGIAVEILLGIVKDEK